MMRVQLKLNSVVLHGVGSGPESGAIDFIYSTLLSEFNQVFYKVIFINQIGDDLNELVMTEAGKKVHVNIRYPIIEDFELKSVDEKNLIRLDIIHQSLVRIADRYGKLNRQELEKIKEKIIVNNFSFNFLIEKYTYQKKENLNASILVDPKIDMFDYFLIVEENKIIKCRIKLYSGLTNIFYSKELFHAIKWKSENELHFFDKSNSIEIKISVKEGKVNFNNLSIYSNPPYFEMMRADISEESRSRAYNDWLHSLPPSDSALLNYTPN